MLLLHSEDQQ